LRERNPLAKPDYLGAFGLLVGAVLFLAYWQAGTIGLVVGYITGRGRTPDGSRQPFQEWQALASLGLTALLLIWVRLDIWQFVALGTTVWLYLRLTRKRIVTLRVSLPDKLGVIVKMKQYPVRLFIQSTDWERRGGGTGVFLGRRIGRKTSLGFGGWSSGSTTTRKEYFEGYTGASVLTEKSLIFIDRYGITRASVNLKEIVASSISTDSGKKLVISYSPTTPKTLVLEYMARSHGEAEMLASRWYEAVRSSLTLTPPLAISAGVGRT